nr:hypothetical protein [Tanacetum cinerariifolium]
MSAQIAEAAALSPSLFCKRYRSSYEISSSSSSPLTLPIRKRYQGTSKLVEDTKDESSDYDTDREGSEGEIRGLEDEGPGSEEEEAAPEGQQQAVSAKDTTVDEPLGLGYGALRCHELVVGEGEMPISPSSPTVPSPIALPVTTLTATISRYRFRSLDQERATMTFSAIWRSELALKAWAENEGHGSEDEGPGLEEGHGYRVLIRHKLVVGEGEMPSTFEVGQSSRVYTNISTYVPPVVPVQTPSSLKWSPGSLPVSPSSLVVPTLIASLVTTPAAIIVVDEDEFLEGYDQELRELYTRSGEVRDDTFSQRYRFRSLEREHKRATVTFSAIWKSREYHDLRMQITKERHERLELTDRVARMERKQESRGE